MYLVLGMSTSLQIQLDDMSISGCTEDQAETMARNQMWKEPLRDFPTVLRE